MAVNTSNTFVIDASYILAYLLPDETTTDVDAVFSLYQKHALHFIAPTLLRYEVLAGLRSAALKKRISNALATQLANIFLEMDIEYHEVSHTDTLKLALKTNLTVYDASYFSLAQTKKVQLYTLDSDLLKLQK